MNPLNFLNLKLMNDIILKSGILRRVVLTKCSDLDVTIRFKGEPDAGYTKADVQLLHTLWSIDQLFDVTLAEASDVKEPRKAINPKTGEIYPA